MKTIYRLPEHIIAQIAAGEVIERPSYAIKELIDNSLDAQATSIVIDLVDAGLSKMIVTDNGIGMSRDDIQESYKLHTTSKIGKSEHLFAIKSLGFRGEALASIASMSILTIESKPATETVGTRIRIHHGKEITTSSLGMPSGTRVVVEQLFENVPVRKKFLHSKRTELRHVLESIEQYALAAPHIAFHISYDGKSYLQLPSETDRGKRIQTVFGDQIAISLLPVSFSEMAVTISGFLVHPQISADITPKQFVAINGRPVSDRLINLAVKEAYGVLLESEKQPSFFLSITLPYEMVDVNVHPRKEQVAFIDEKLLFDSITKAVSVTLQSQKISFHSPTDQTYPQGALPSTRSFLGNKLKEAVGPYNTGLLVTEYSGKQYLQIHNLYIVTTSKHGVMVVDQHAAHERILYEKYQQQFLIEKKHSVSQPLAKQVLLELSGSESTLVEELQPQFLSLGFRIEPFHGFTWKVSHVPEVFLDRDCRQLIMEMITTVSQRSYLPLIDSQSKKMLAFLSCKSAVKSGDPLTQEQMRDILFELEKIPGAATCPHGRPVQWEISLTELNKLFKRG